MKKKIIILIGAIVILLLCFYLSFITEEIPIYSNSNDVKQSVLQDITDGVEISQEFITDQKEVAGLELRFATYGKSLTGNLAVAILYADNQEVIYSNTIDTSKIEDNQMYTLEFEKPIVFKDDNIIVTVKGMGTQQGNSATIYCYDKVTDNTTLRVNNEVMKDRTLNMCLLHDTFSYKRLIYLSLTILLLYFYILFVMRSVISKK